MNTEIKSDNQIISDFEKGKRRVVDQLNATSLESYPEEHAKSLKKYFQALIRSRKNEMIIAFYRQHLQAVYASDQTLSLELQELLPIILRAFANKRSFVQEFPELLSKAESWFPNHESLADVRIAFRIQEGYKSTFSIIGRFINVIVCFCVFLLFMYNILFGGTKLNLFLAGGLIALVDFLNCLFLSRSPKSRTFGFIKIYLLEVLALILVLLSSMYEVVPYPFMYMLLPGVLIGFFTWSKNHLKDAHEG